MPTSAALSLQQLAELPLTTAAANLVAVTSRLPRRAA